MRLLVPHTGEVDAADARLVRLAEFLGVTCELPLLENRAAGDAGQLEELSRGDAACFVVNPRVMKDWTGGSVSQELASCLVSRFRFVLIHGLTTDTFSQSLTRLLSGHRLQSVERVPDASDNYEISLHARHICGPFSGISFGPVNSVNDCVLSITDNRDAPLSPITIGGKPFLAITKQNQNEALFLASADTLDLDATAPDKPLSDSFSRFVPQAMMLRYVFGEECWHPNEHCASFTIDDPLLRRKYGHLDFETLLGLMKAKNFATTIAFIPHNYRRNSQQTVQMFLRNSDRLSICFHGNDHTAGEFAATDDSFLDTTLSIAEARMDLHEKASGLTCEKVMVFPQDNFSAEAMRALRFHNFIAGVSGAAHPMGCRVDYSFAELAQPAILRYSDSPLFLRRYIGRFKKEDIAYDLFFGKPILIYEHHDVFKQVEPLIEAVDLINSIKADIRWCDLATAVMNSSLRRKTADGVWHVRAFSGALNIANRSESPQRFVAEWDNSPGHFPVEHVLVGAQRRSFEITGPSVCISAEIAPHCSQRFSLVVRNDRAGSSHLGLIWDAKAFVRRRLSEVRDNYVSKNDFALTLAQSVKRRFLSKVF